MRRLRLFGEIYQTRKGPFGLSERKRQRYNTKWPILDTATNQGEENKFSGAQQRLLLLVHLLPPGLALPPRACKEEIHLGVPHIKTKAGLVSMI